MLTISGNLLKEPDNPKYGQFKTENNVIKKTLVEVRGALEYAVAVSVIHISQVIVDLLRLCGLSFLSLASMLRCVELLVYNLTHEDKID